MKLYNVYSYEYEVTVYVRGALIEPKEPPIPSSGIMFMPEYEKGELVRKDKFTINVVARSIPAAKKRVNALFDIEEDKYYDEFDCNNYIIETELIKENIIKEDLKLFY